MIQCLAVWQCPFVNSAVEAVFRNVFGCLASSGNVPFVVAVFAARACWAPPFGVAWQCPFVVSAIEAVFAMFFWLLG